MNKLSRLATTLKEARLAHGLSQADVATAIGRSRMHVADLERGRVLPGSTNEYIALGAVLCLDPIDLKRAAIESEVGRHLDGGYLDAEAPFATMERAYSPKARPMRFLDIEAKAEGFAMSRWPKHVELGAAMPIDDLLAGFDDIGPALGVAARVEFERHPTASAGVVDAEGWAKYLDDDVIEISVRADVFDRAIEGHGRARFVVAHEVGHAALHASLMAERPGEPLFRDDVCTATERLAPGARIYESPEWQANTYASALLMPTEAVKAFIRAHAQRDSECGVGEIAEHFRVSRQAAEIRMRKLLPRLVGP